MKDEAEALVENIKIYSDGLALAIQKGNIQESSEYVEKMKIHLVKIQEYLEMKKSIPEN